MHWLPKNQYFKHSSGIEEYRWNPDVPSTPGLCPSVCHISVFLNVSLLSLSSLPVVKSCHHLLHLPYLSNARRNE